MKILVSCLLFSTGLSLLLGGCQMLGGASIRPKAHEGEESASGGHCADYVSSKRPSDLISICRADGETIAFKMVSGDGPSARDVMSGIAVRVNAGLDPDTGVDNEGVAYPVATYYFERGACRFEVGIGEAPDFDRNLEIIACECSGNGERFCALGKGVLFEVR